MTDNYSVITFATNKLSYMQFALNCAQSVLLHNDINIYIVSNLQVEIPEKLEKNVFIIPAVADHASLGIGIKLHIDQYLQTENTLFIDSDCLCYASLAPVFEAFAGKDVSVVGTVVNAAEWCGFSDAVVIEKEFGIKKLPRFNGGVYFLKKSVTTTAIFDKARLLMPKYDVYGFSRLKNGWVNEEILIAIAMVINHQLPIPDDGRYMTDFHTDHHPRELNVLKGIRILNNPKPGKSRHRPWYPVGTYSPVILHFGGEKLHSFPYITQYAMLKLNLLNWGNGISSLISKVVLQFPYQFYRSSKRLFQNNAG